MRHLDELCHVCLEPNPSIRQTIRIRDDKSTYDITGHIHCTDPIYEFTQQTKGFDKMPVKKVLMLLKENNLINSID
ncbi:hypothetical protein [Bacillus infantis]|uniref:hypothetical protein n=1 Tax=Bacillus infantis TaxID=324767 RepID=UPI0020A0F629|nr:hypothetical protein [Bacillus infantis]MCP1159274.1 hypothetical protein [Bacillus infantis]